MRHVATGHPHASGESSTASLSVNADNGSSPREWGKRPCCPRRGWRLRVIPTRVGKARGRRGGLDRAAGHPHASGESSTTWPAVGDINGSSPREWGKRLSFFTIQRPKRVIPTRVGKAAQSPQGQMTSTGHPHASGESPNGYGVMTNNNGSSPREWGKPIRITRMFRALRVIPTRVGKASRSAGDENARAGHPHASGESAVWRSAFIQRVGSSPREWGKLFRLRRLGRFCRVIPTRVGKASMAKDSAHSMAGHPHASGESFRKNGLPVLLGGSSPREWGKLSIYE